MERSLKRIVNMQGRDGSRKAMSELREECGRQKGGRGVKKRAAGEKKERCKRIAEDKGENKMYRAMAKLLLPSHPQHVSHKNP